MSKYQNTIEPEDFPLIGEGDEVAWAAHMVMVEGETIAAASDAYGVTQGAVSMRCKRIADGLQHVRMKVQAQALYDLTIEALSFAPSAWHSRAVKIIKAVEGK